MTLRLVWSDEQKIFPIDEQFIQQLEHLLQLAGEQEDIHNGEVALSFVTDEDIRELNKQYRNIDKATDVLSFAMTEIGDEELDIIYDDLEDLEQEDETEEADEYEEPLGDIIISVPRAIAQAEDYGHSIERELGFLFVHGFLHLIGYDHGTSEEEKDMFTRQESVLEKAGLTR